MFEFNKDKDLCPRIKIIGVEDFGAKMVNYLIANILLNVEFAVVATKNETLLQSSAPQRIKIDDAISEKSKRNLSELLKDLDVLFIFTDLADENISTQIAELAKNILTVAIVPKSALNTENFQKSVDTLVVVEDENIFLMYSAVRCINNLIEPGLVGLDFADIKSILENSGRGYVAYGKATDETPTIDAMKNAINSMKDILRKSKRILLCIISSTENLSMMEVNEATIILQEETHSESEIIWGVAIDVRNDNFVEVSIIATDLEK